MLLAALVGCSDPSSGFTVVAGGGQKSLAGTTLTTPVVLKLRGVGGSPMADQRVTVRPTNGGRLDDSVAFTGADGNVVLPRWTLGTSAGTYTVAVASAGYSAEVTAEATSDFPIAVRYFGKPLAPEQQRFFDAAAQRIRGVVTGSVPPVAVQGLDLAADSICGVKGLPVLRETVKGMIVFAAVDSIDGRGKTLAQAGGCLLRKFTAGGQQVQLPLVGIMTFDRDDWPTMIAQGNAQDVITHEMLHLVGVGMSTWMPKQLMRDSGLATVAFTGRRAMQGCDDARGVSFCSTGVPLENFGGPGTRDTHWRETTFGNELMTGFADRCPPAPQPCSYPLSGITVGALQDVGYVVNFSAADAYAVPQGATMRMAPADPGAEWERPLKIPVWEVLPSGASRRVKPQP